MILLRRMLVIVALMFWQGGFTFYAAVVVPVGQKVLASHVRQGFITKEVTNYLNLAGAVALVLLAWDILACHDPSAARRRARWLAWVIMAVCLLTLFYWHTRLDVLLDLDSETILDRGPFRTLHRQYLWVSTLQWAAGVAYLLLTLISWQREEERRGYGDEGYKPAK